MASIVAPETIPSPIEQPQRKIISRASIQNANENADIFTFTLNHVNVSLANALRRVILTDIPTVVFRTSPYERNQTTIHINTTRLNNEILKHRLSCIPIYITDHTIDLSKYVVELDKKNETDTIQNVTTEDFRIKDTETSKYLTDDETKRMFPPDPITKDYILIVRLRPKISDSISGEELKLEAKMEIGTAKENSTFNTSSTCSYAYTANPIHQQREWQNKIKLLKEQGLTEDEIEYEEYNWKLSDAKRIVLQDSFDFIIETLGVFSNKELVEYACDIMIQKCDTLLESITASTISILEATTTMKNSFDIILENEDYTLGKCIEFAMNHFFYVQERKLAFVGFRKQHPSDSDSIVRIAFKKEGSIADLYGMLQVCAEYVKTTFVRIRSQL